jgi:hypothetical protein
MLLTVGMTSEARADEMTAAECVAASEQAGPLRRAGKLRESRDNLRRCSSADTCPKLVRKDCIAAAEEANADIPTVAFSVHDHAGNELGAVTVTVDGRPFADRLDGTAIEVDPGDHLFVFESPGQPRVEKRFLILEGEKNRHEHVLMGEAPPSLANPPNLTPLPATPAPASNRRRTMALALGGAGLGFLAVGAISGFLAVSEWDAAKQNCGSGFPLTCRSLGPASTDRSESLVAAGFADVTLALGAAGVITGTVLLLTAPTPGLPATPTARVTLSPQVGAGIGGLVIRGVF